MVILKGHVVQGCKHFQERLTRASFCAAYRKATGEDLVPDNPGIWLFHCHMSDHMARGMVARYKVEP